MTDKKSLAPCNACRMLKASRKKRQRGYALVDSFIAFQMENQGMVICCSNLHP